MLERLTGDAIRVITVILALEVSLRLFGAVITFQALVMALIGFGLILWAGTPKAR